jgi:hypothetical protein
MWFFHPASESCAVLQVCPGFPRKLAAMCLAENKPRKRLTDPRGLYAALLHAMEFNDGLQ